MAEQSWIMGGGLPGPVRFMSEGAYMQADDLFKDLRIREVTDPASAFQLVVWAYRAINLRAMTIGGLPYHILDAQGEEVDWPLADELTDLIGRIEYALCLEGASYLLKLAKGRQLVGFQWLNPQTMKEATNPEGTEIVGFKQRVDHRAKVYPADDVIYHTLFNPDDDLGQGVSPMDVALSAAGIGHNTNVFTESFFKNGAIPAIVLSTEQDLRDPDVLQVRSMWERLFRGVRKAWRTAILKKGLKPTTIGSPIKDLALKPMYASVREQIAVAFGIPQTMLEDAANFATAREHKLSFYYETIFPEARFIARGLNRQLFDAMGLLFEFQFRAVEAIQQDEAQKSTALQGLYVAGLIDRDEARADLGYEVTEPEPQDDNDVDDEADDEPPVVIEPVSRAAFQDLARWRRKASRGNVEFVSDMIPEWLQIAVRSRLADPRFADHAFGPALRRYDRMQAENQLQKRVLQELDTDLDEITESALDLVMPTEQLQATENRLISAVGTILMGIAVDVILEKATETGVSMDHDQVMNDAAIWASQHSAELVKGITETSKKGLQRVIANLTDGQITREDAIEQIKPLFGKVRAEAIATTEVTRAQSAATDSYVEDLKERGVQVVTRWLTAEDERVCPICGPLDHKTEEVWRQEFPLGPPAHPRCRCQTVVEAKPA